MKISRNWLQKYFEEELPNAEALSDALTFHVFEIDGIEEMRDSRQGGDASDYVLDVKVTPNRGHDCLSHIGIAKEISAILKLPLKSDPFAGNADFTAAGQRGDASKSAFPANGKVSVSLENPALCKRYIAAYIKGVQVGPSPSWLKESLEAIGQRSINNVVDATNYVMFSLGQPLHAFDAGKLAQKDGRYAIEVRTAKPSEKLLALDEKEYQLSESMLVIADANNGEAIGIAGIKGGMPAGITTETKDIILESANFDGISVRKTAQTLKLRTDASARFEQQISPELAAFGMRAVVDLITEIAGGEVAGFVDVYPKPQERRFAAVTVEKINSVLGATLTGAEVADVFVRLGFAYKEEAGVFEVHVPFQRLDLEIPEDLVEEVGRIQGYDKVPATVLPPLNARPEINERFYWSERFREALVEQGFSEVLTSVFSDEGERVVLNKVDGVRPYLRASLRPGLIEALKKNIPNKELLGLEEVKLFEIGTVFLKGSERLMLAVGILGKEKKKDIQLNLDIGHSMGYAIVLQPPSYVKEIDFSELLEQALPDINWASVGTMPEHPLSQTERYQPFSKYPYIVRDVALWTPAGVGAEAIETLIKGGASELCVKISLFDRFEKEGRVSLAYRLIFQSFEKTLTDEEVNPIMEKVYAALKEKGFEIR